MTISVVIPVYKVSAYIERCIGSVMNQTYADFECILVDDASPDDSIAKCERMIAEYDGAIHFRILRHNRNRGLSAARNTGITASTYDYILFVDSDDEITKDCVEQLIRVAKRKPGVELVQGLSKCISSERRRSRKCRSLVAEAKSNDEARLSFYHHQLKITAWNKLIKRDFIIAHQLFFMEGILFEDSVWMFNMIKHLSYVSFCEVVTYYYHSRSDSITIGTDLHTSAIHRFISMRSILSHLTPGKEHEELNYYAIDLCKYYAKYRQDVKEYDDLFRMYLNLSREYHCTPWLAVFVSFVVGHIPYCWNVLRFLRRSLLQLRSVGCTVK